MALGPDSGCTVSPVISANRNESVAVTKVRPGGDAVEGSVDAVLDDLVGERAASALLRGADPGPESARFDGWQIGRMYSNRRTVAS